MEQIEKIIRQFSADTGKKCNFIVALQLDDGHHVQQIRIDVHDDHHLMDLLTGIHETWWKSHHQTRTCTQDSGD